MSRSPVQPWWLPFFGLLAGLIVALLCICNTTPGSSLTFLVAGPLAGPAAMIAYRWWGGFGVLLVSVLVLGVSYLLALGFRAKALPAINKWLEDFNANLQRMQAEQAAQHARMQALAWPRNSRLQLCLRKSVS